MKALKVHSAKKYTQSTESTKLRVIGLSVHDVLDFSTCFSYFRLDWELTREMKNTIHQCLQNYQNVVR